MRRRNRRRDLQIVEVVVVAVVGGGGEEEEFFSIQKQRTRWTLSRIVNGFLMLGNVRSIRVEENVMK